MPRTRAEEYHDRALFIAANLQVQRLSLPGRPSTVTFQVTHILSLPQERHGHGLPGAATNTNIRRIKSLSSQGASNMCAWVTVKEVKFDRDLGGSSLRVHGAAASRRDSDGGRRVQGREKRRGQPEINLPQLCDVLGRLSKQGSNFTSFRGTPQATQNCDRHTDGAHWRSAAPVTAPLSHARFPSPRC
jgi:hypothetical protein